MRFSIIIPLYQQERYVRECVESVLSQSFSDIQVLLVDDGSTDFTPSICDEFARRDQRVSVIHKKNEGPSIARNLGVKSAKGEYIVFLDGDDLIAEGALSNVNDAILKHGSPDLIVCTISQFTNSPSEAKPLDSLDGLAEHGKADELIEFIREKGSKYCISPCRYAIKKSFHEQRGLTFEPGLLHEDERYTPRLICAAESYAAAGGEFYLYRYHEGSRNTRLNIENKLHMLASSAELLRERERYCGNEARLSFLNSRAEWLFKSGLLQSTSIPGRHASKVAAAAEEAYRIKPDIIFCIPKLKSLVRILGPKHGTAAFLRLVKLERGIKSLLGK